MSINDVQKVTLEERYHLFQKGDEICRYGIYGLIREYFQHDDPQAHEYPARSINLTVPTPRLKVIQAVITSDCNLNCVYCSFAANAPELPQKRMSEAELEALCHRFNTKIGKSGLLLITGGEPELYREAVDYLIANLNGKIILFTNGTLTTAERLEFYQKHDVGVLFSLDGDLFAQESVRVSKDGSYRKIAASLKMAREAGLNYGISAVVGDHNIERLPQLVEEIHATFKPASIGLNLPHKYGETAWLRIEEYTAALLDIFQYAKRSGLFVDQINRRLAPLINQSFRFRDCSAQGEKEVIYPGGAVMSCVNQAGLKHEVNWAEQIPFKREFCADCFAIGLCGGGCLFDGNAINGPDCFDPRNCYLTKTLLEHFIWDFRAELYDDAADRARLQTKYSALLQRREGTFLSVGHDTV
ncbi:radical SAM protein [bacterium]|nr:radical SAM protein [bacterium]MBU1650586.1 radical SAM protein [bacterium]MBU1881887.1 radical SAM protein [bacterium]